MLYLYALQSLDDPNTKLWVQSSDGHQSVKYVPQIAPCSLVDRIQGLGLATRTSLSRIRATSTGSVCICAKWVLLPAQYHASEYWRIWNWNNFHQQLAHTLKKGILSRDLYRSTERLCPALLLLCGQTLFLLVFALIPPASKSMLDKRMVRQLVLQMFTSPAKWLIAGQSGLPCSEPKDIPTDLPLSSQHVTSQVPTLFLCNLVAKHLDLLAASSYVRAQLCRGHTVMNSWVFKRSCVYRTI